MTKVAEPVEKVAKKPVRAEVRASATQVHTQVKSAVKDARAQIRNAAKDVRDQVDEATGDVRAAVKKAVRVPNAGENGKDDTSSRGKAAAKGSASGDD
ncbi:hypothetical protein [Mycobacterium sp. NPDC050441]|uniref:hypothetical protein n=1 Tax=Mycobacterium sp. NPDC050441 TaxID=3155403 RepID=UPI0033E7C602